MKLRVLISSLDTIYIIGNLDNDIVDITYNSANSKKGTIFVALVGMTMDGHRYIQGAYENGCRVFLISKKDFIEDEKNSDIVKNSTFILVEDTRDSLANISNIFFGEPSKKMTIIGITGTKGKTTVSNYIKYILDSANMECGVIGTNGIYYKDKYIKTINTTPESYEIQKFLKEMADAGIKYVAMEVSSGGIMMNRVNYIDFKYAIFTNLSPDHIGEKEHPTFEHYRQCKAKLFSMSDYSIINQDDENAYFMKNSSKKIYTFSINDENADFYAKNIKYPTSINSIYTKFLLKDDEYTVNSFGEFGVYNALATISVCEKLGVDRQIIKSSLSKVHVKGRLQTLNILKDIPIIIDYAHNQVSLENILKTIKSLNPNRIITVFGSIGTRAKHRRIELAEVSSKYSDIIIITSDNPDTEDPLGIIDEIYTYISDDKRSATYRYVDRADAIRKAIEISKIGDVILLAGKGHEQYQLINGERQHFSDEEEAVKYAKQLNKYNTSK